MSSGRKANNGRGSGRGRGRNNRRSSGGRGIQMYNSNYLPDEEVLIQFMSFIRNHDTQAVRIHQLHGNDERAFVQAARAFLLARKDMPEEKISKLSVEDDPIVEVTNNPPRLAPIQRSPPRSPIPGQKGGTLSQPMKLPEVLFPEQRLSPVPNQLNSHPGKISGIGITQQYQSDAPLRQAIQVESVAQGVTTQPQLSQNAFVSQPLPSGTYTPPLGFSQSSALKPAPPGLVMQPRDDYRSTPTTGVNHHEAKEDDIVEEAPVEVVKAKPISLPKRLWTRMEEQPGRLSANDIPADGPSISLRPRQEVRARWILPLKYLRQRMVDNDMDPALTIRDALKDLTVGLFRRGCPENGTNAGIISKEVLAPINENRSDYPFEVDPKSDTVSGTIPFYAPRTPGHVLFRLYWQSEPLYTLAVGPTILVCVTEEDFEPTLRFILSNFKSRKGSATSLSSFNALTTALEQFRPQNRRSNLDGAGRAAWGCVCESRKVLELCATEYLRGKEKIRKLQLEIEELELALALEDTEVTNSEESPIEEMRDKSTKTKIKERINLMMGTRASNDRKWKDAQVAFANILHTIISSPSLSLLFRRELIAKIRLEHDLWCPLVEAFAPSPFNSNDSICVNFDEFPQHVTASHHQQCKESRMKMQKEILGFIPKTTTLDATLFKNNQQRTMDRKVVDALNNLSSAMGRLYEDVYMVADRIHQQREMVRARVESIVAKCNAFPPGTRVLVFGSSANGFGSPTSDLDMCLQLPPNTKLPGELKDPTGAQAMAELARVLETTIMQSVCTARLTARIPIIMFNCPRPMAEEGESELMECDLSFLNSLAVLNTSLLLTYSRIHPATRVLAAIIKRWAKARDINNPSKHTLSTYGYIIMLLHFLTYHRRKGNGLISSFDSEPTLRNQTTAAPLIPNLQWMDPDYVKAPLGQSSYSELDRIPMQCIQHPLEAKLVVNTYYHHVNNAEDLSEIQKRFPSQDLSLAILLASFFRYFAFEFDYKRHVVSLHATMKGGMVEREVKAEIHGWKVYTTGLAVEDPFETFYDVAHVIKGSSFHRLRNEFALAYTKIISTIESGTAVGGMDLIDLICEPIESVDEERVN